MLHEYDKMEEKKAKQLTENKPGVTAMGVSDTLEITQKDQDGNIKSQMINGKDLHKMEVKK